MNPARFRPPWLTIALFGLAILLLIVARARDGAQQCHVTAVLDGDTISCQEFDANIRLAGIDAPETIMANACGGEAEIALGNAARMAVHERVVAAGWLVTLTEACASCDRYGRIVARVWVAGEDVGQWLVRQGLARTWQSDAEHAAGSNEFWCQ